MNESFLIFIPFHNPWHWHTDYPNQTAIGLSDHHTVFCFLWGDAVSLKEIVQGKRYMPIRKTKHCWYYQPLALLPGKRLFAMQRINLTINVLVARIFCWMLMRRHRLTMIFWYFGIFDPAFLLLPGLFRHTRTVYDCVDTPDHPDPTIATRLRATEAEILRRAWIVTANSQTLYRRLRKLRSDTSLVPLGFREEIFHEAKPMHLPFPRHAPVIGYIGAIDYRIDVTLLTKLASTHRSWHFALIGPVFYDHLTPKEIHALRTLLSFANVYHTTVSPSRIPSLLRRCAVTIIPYRSSLAFNRYAFPMKTMEYLYAKKRVITSPITELIPYRPIIRTAHSFHDWEHALTEAFTKPLTAQERKRARGIAHAHSWQKKIQTLQKVLRAKQGVDYGQSTSHK